MRDSRFFAQADLLVRCLPALDAADKFALKGGTSINLFCRDMPRLSVDIDLAFLPTIPRAAALAAIEDGLVQVTSRARQLIPGMSVIKAGTEEAPKCMFSAGAARVMVEPNTVFRGSVFPPERRSLCPAAETLFGRSARVNVLSFADVYAGKLCAALDRGHPRDWFDVLLLMRDDGLSGQLRQAFVVYLAGNHRPMSELLEPTLADLTSSFERDFVGMPRLPASLGELRQVQHSVPAMLRAALTSDERRFLLSIKRGEPEWERLPIAHVAELSAIQWKLQNIEVLKRTPARHAAAIDKLRRVLEI